MTSSIDSSGAFVEVFNRAPLLSVDDCPVGLSFAAGHGQDEFLLDAVQALTGD